MLPAGRAWWPVLPRAAWAAWGARAAIAAGLRDLRLADYRFSLDLERLLRSSFPAPGDAERVRALFEADLGVDRMGLGLQREGGMITLCYPVVIVAGSKAA